MRRKLIATVAPVVLALGLLLSPAGARAQGGLGSCCDFSSLVPIAAIGVAVPILVFTIGDLVYAGRSEWLPESWAIGQIVFGVILTGLGVVAVEASTPSLDLTIPAASAFLTAHSAWLLLHGILSLVYRRREPPEPPTPDESGDMHVRALGAHRREAERRSIEAISWSDSNRAGGMRSMRELAWLLR